MIDIAVQTRIARPPEEVFAVVADPAQLPAWQATTVSAETEDGGPLRLGSRIREVHRGPGGRQLASVVEVAALEPGCRLDLRVLEGALPIHADIAFAPDGDATIVRFRAHGRPGGAQRLLTPLLRIGLRRQFAADLERLRVRLEDGDG